MHGFYRLMPEKRCFDLLTTIYEQIQNYDADCTITPLATKTRRSIYPRPTATEVFDKLSRAVSLKRKSYKSKQTLLGTE